MIATLTVIVDGALEREEVFADYLMLQEAIAEEKRDAAGHGYPVDLYVLEHNHGPDVADCDCAQYATDHRPVWSSPGIGAA